MEVIIESLRLGHVTNQVVVILLRPLPISDSQDQKLGVLIRYLSVLDLIKFITTGIAGNTKPSLHLLPYSSNLKGDVELK